MDLLITKLLHWWSTTSDFEKAWLGFGFLGQGMFFMRFVIQWRASEKVKRSVVPETFWYFSFVGGLMTFIYAVYKEDPVFMVSQFSGMFIYSRNIYLIWAHKRRTAEEEGLTAIK